MGRGIPISRDFSLVAVRLRIAGGKRSIGGYKNWQMNIGSPWTAHGICLYHPGCLLSVRQFSAREVRTLLASSFFLSLSLSLNRPTRHRRFCCRPIRTRNQMKYFGTSHHNMSPFSVPLFLLLCFVYSVPII